MGKDAEIASDCDNFLLFLKIMAKVPVNFTTADWVASVEQLGAIKGGYGEDAVFGPGKYDGGDTYALVEWHRECTCWIQIRGYQPGQV
jgi:hypothetical protein